MASYQVASLGPLLAEWTEAELPKEYGAYSNWIMHFDGSKMLAGLGAGIVLTSPTGDTVQYVLQILYTDSNNAAEYEALLYGLWMAVSMGIQRLEVRGDSNLAISQINGDLNAKDPKRRPTVMSSLKCRLDSRGLSFITWFEKIIKRRMSVPASALSATSSHLTYFWKGSSSHPWCGKGRAATLVRIRL